MRHGQQQAELVPDDPALMNVNASARIWRQLVDEPAPCRNCTHQQRDHDEDEHCTLCPCQEFQYEETE